MTIHRAYELIIAFMNCLNGLIGLALVLSVSFDVFEFSSIMVGIFCVTPVMQLFHAANCASFVEILPARVVRIESAILFVVHGLLSTWFHVELIGVVDLPYTRITSVAAFLTLTTIRGRQRYSHSIKETPLIWRSFLTLLIVSCALCWLVTRRPQLPSPTASTATGIYKSPVVLGFDCSNPAATIRWSADGSDPRLKSTIGAELRINKSATVQASSFAIGFKPSKPSRLSYILPSSLSDETVPRRGTESPTRLSNAIIPDTKLSRGGSILRNDGNYCHALEHAIVALPIMSIIADPKELFGKNGIYDTPELRGKKSEIAVFAEFIAGKNSFSIPAGLRIHGDLSREKRFTRKHSFRLIFRKEYGAGKLRSSLFSTAPEKFDKLVLRGFLQDSWSPLFAAQRALFARDSIVRHLHAECGRWYARSQFVHLFLNGTYWGVYEMLERPDAKWFADRYGGDDEDWDVIKDGTVQSGNTLAWNRLLEICDEANRELITGDECFNRITKISADQASNTIPQLLDVDDFIDFIIVNCYAQNSDWGNANFISARRRNGNFGFRFLIWDAEQSFGLGEIRNPLHESVGAVGRILHALSKCKRFRQRFHQRTNELLLSENGVLNLANVDIIFRRRTTVLEMPLAAESLRWGQHRQYSYGVADWRSERDRLLHEFFPNRAKRVMYWFCEIGLIQHVDEHGDLRTFCHHLANNSAVRNASRYDLRIRETMMWPYGLTPVSPRDGDS